MAARFNIVGIMKPGLVNIKLDGRFQNVKLFEASDEVLEKLYLSGCQYIQMTPGEFLKNNKNLSDIKVERLDLSGKNVPAKKPRGNKTRPSVG